MFKLRAELRISTVAMALIILGLCAFGANAQSLDEVNDLNRQIEHLFQAGKYKEAIPIAEQARSLADNGTPRGHIMNILQLERLAAINRALGNILAAKDFRQQASKLIKTHAHANRIKYAMAVNNRAGIFLTQEFNNVVGKFFHARAVFQGHYKADHWTIGVALNNAAEALKAQKRYGDAEKYSKQAVAVLEKTLEAGDIRLILATLNRSELVKLTRNIGYDINSRLLRFEAANLIKKHWRKEQPGAATALAQAATLYMAIDPNGIAAIMRDFSIRPNETIYQSISQRMRSN